MTQDQTTHGPFARFGGFLSMVRQYLGIGNRVHRIPIRDPQALRDYLDTRASFIAQTSLYGYMRTRAGQRYPELFENDGFVELLNAAKWRVWLACLSDLGAFSGGLLARRGMPEERVGMLMRRLVDQVLEKTGIPAEADEGFAEHAQQVRARIALTPWSRIGDDEGCFHESPEALVRHAPIVKTLMELDADIVRNSVRFRWKEVRFELRDLLDAKAVDAAFEP